MVCNEQQSRDLAPTLAAVGFEVRDPEPTATRARALKAPAVFRRTHAGRAGAAGLPRADGTEIFLAADGR